jgi:hypothetical protein
MAYFFYCTNIPKIWVLIIGVPKLIIVYKYTSSIPTGQKNGKKDNQTVPNFHTKRNRNIANPASPQVRN